MAQYIDKAALVAEIKRRMNYWHFKPGQIKASYAEEEDRDILSFLDTLEVKEVDLENEIGKYLDVNNIEYGFQVKLFDLAKHFFELGMAVNNKAQKKL